jgi:DNA-directed RNA polymerase subunit E'/Rpb7
MNNPYITTYLTTTVRILPREMDNNIRKYIKSSLEKEHVDKCYQDYGYIVKVHEMEIMGDGRIIPEDPMCCARFNVKFLCTLCRPINNTFIIAKVINMSEKLIILSYGPLHIIINTLNSINKNIFVFNQNISRWAAKKKSDDADIKNTKNIKQTDKTNSKDVGAQKYIVLKTDTYVRVKILSKKIIDKTKQIICLGFMEDIVLDDEIKQSIKDVYEPYKYDSIDDAINVEKEIQMAIYANANTETESGASEDEQNDL